MITIQKDIENKELLELHLEVLTLLLNDKDFEEIKILKEERMEALNYISKANGTLLSFSEGKLVGAYPISPKKSSYKVTVEGVGTGYAMCAIDALGVAYTFMKKTHVETKILGTDEVFKITIDPFAESFETYPLYVTYTKIDDSCENAALEQCPSINIYQSKDDIPEIANLETMDFDNAMRHAKARFSQVALDQCFSGSFSGVNLALNVDETQIVSQCDC